MKKLLKVLVVLLVLLMIILPAAWLTIPRWLPAVVKSSPPNVLSLITQLLSPAGCGCQAQFSLIHLPGRGDNVIRGQRHRRQLR